MPVFDTPITTDDQNLSKVLGQKLPVVLYLYDQSNPKVEQTLRDLAHEHSGKLLVARVDAGKNAQTYAQYRKPQLPALLTLDEGAVESRAENIQPADVEEHVDFLLGLGPKPLENAGRATSGTIPVSDASFSRDVLQSAVPVLVDFWAPWCGPCHTVAPTLERLAQQYAGKIKIAKLNVDENPQTAQQYRAMSIPMLLMFKDGKLAGKLVGAHPKPNIEQLIRQAL
jgi:thioredoxin